MKEKGFKVDNQLTSNQQPQNGTQGGLPTPEGSPGPAESSRKKIIIFGLIGLLVAVAIASGIYIWLQGSKKPAALPTVKVGLMVPLAGRAVSSGTAMQRGFDLAMKDLAPKNANIEKVVKSTNCDAPAAEKAIKELVAEGVVVVVGEGCSSATLAAAPTANANKVVMVSPGSTNPSVTDAGDYVFRVIPSDALAAEFAAKLLYNDRGLRHLGIIYSNEEYGKGYSTQLKENFVKLGGRVTSEHFEGDTTVVTEQLRRLQTAKPDALFIASTSYSTPVSILQAKKSLGFTVPVYASEVLKDQNFLKDAGSMAEGITIFAVSDGTPSFIEKYNGAYTADPDLYSAQGYDATTAVLKAISSGAFTGEAIKDAIYKLDFEGATGRIVFDKNGDVPSNYTLYQVVDGKTKVVQP